MDDRHHDPLGRQSGTFNNHELLIAILKWFFCPHSKISWKFIKPFHEAYSYSRIKLILNLRLSEWLNERLIQKVKSPIEQHNKRNI